MEGSREKNGYEPEIVITGVGGAGNNAIHRLCGLGKRNLRPMAINTDRVHIEIIDCPTKVLIGEDLTHGLGAAGSPEIGEECAKKASKEIGRIIGRPDVLFVVAGLGGGTGTGASVVVARIGRNNGAFVVSVVTMPFSFEGRRKEVAEKGLERLRESADLVVVIDNDRLIEIGGNLPVEDAFTIIDHLIFGLIDNITRNISLPKKIKEDAPLGMGPLRLMPPMTLEVQEEDIEDHMKEKEPPPLVTVDFKGMAKLVDTEEPRSVQGIKMAEHFVEEVKVKMPKKSNVLIRETRPLTLIPFLLPQDERYNDNDYLKELMRKNRPAPGPERGGNNMKPEKEKDDNEKTTRPMTQMKLDHLWV